MTTGMSLDEFLNHSTGTGGKGGSFLKWKDRTPPCAHVVLHTQASIVALWRHQLPEVRELKTEDGDKVLRVWSGRWLCLEDEKPTLKRQYVRDKKTGQRKYPPQVCPLCILIETLIRMINDGKLGFCAPIFKYEGDDPKDERIITAGGFTNLYSKKELSSEEKGAMRKAGIRLTESWKENGYAKCSYILRVVDVEHPDEGIQIATETAQLGDDIKRVIRDAIQARGDVDGHPLRKPYVIRWEYNDAALMSEKYRAVGPMDRLVISDAVMKLITNEPPPSIDYLVKPPDLELLRAQLEQHCLIELPWNEIFGPSMQLAKEDPRPTHDSRSSSGKAAAGNQSATAPKQKEAISTAKSTPSGEEAEVFECDACGVECLGRYDSVCSACGAQYDPETGALLSGQSNAAVSAAAVQDSGWATDGGDDDIPF